MIALKNILVATDFGEASEAALAYGRELAQMGDATLHLIHVTDDLVNHYPIGIYPVVYPDVQADVNADALKQVEARLSDDDRVQLHAKTVVRTSGRTAAAIVGYATEADIDLIVLGTQGRGSVSRLIMGSVAESVVRTAPCPVLTVRHPEREFIVHEPVAIAVEPQL